MILWKRNLVTVWLAQFFAIMGFSFAQPFAPFFIQELGITDPDALKFWVALFTAATPFTLAFFSPLWGALADRYGRRIMLLRANMGGMLVLLLMGLTPNVQVLVALRLLQGTLTGTMTAAQVMVAAQTPANRCGMALGSLSAAVFSGTMTGSFFGGVFAEWFGYRVAFMLSSLFLLIASLLVLLGTREDAIQSASDRRCTRPQREGFRTRLLPVLPILMLIMVMAFVRQFDKAWLPLLVQEIHGTLQGASLRSGMLLAIGGIGGFLGGPLIGRFADRYPPPRIGKISSLFAGFTMVLLAVSPSLLWLSLTQFGVIFFAGGLDPVFQIWLSKSTARQHQGFVFGWSVTAKSVGWIAAPVVSGAVAWMGGVRAVFLVCALCYLLLIPVINKVVIRMARLEMTRAA